jgi:hypothetical protein
MLKSPVMSKKKTVKCVALFYFFQPFLPVPCSEPGGKRQAVSFADGRAVPPEFVL